MENTNHSPSEKLKAVRRWILEARLGQTFVAFVTLPACGVLVGEAINIVQLQIFMRDLFGFGWPAGVLLRLIGLGALAVLFYVVGSAALIDLIQSFERKPKRVLMR